MKNKTKIALAAVPLTIALGASSCDQKGLGDAPVGKAIEDERLVIVMPDEFPNFAVVCDGTTAIYAHTRPASPIVVPNSVLCDGKGKNNAKGVDEGERTEVPG